jgi:hypothetical protein
VSPEVSSALSNLIAALEATDDEGLGKVVVCDFDAKRHMGGVISSETRSAIESLMLRMSKY